MARRRLLNFGYSFVLIGEWTYLGAGTKNVLTYIGTSSHISVQAHLSKANGRGSFAIA